MKKNILVLCLCLFNMINMLAQQSNPDCPNGDMESGNFSHWSVYTGTSANPQNMNTFVPNVDATRASVACGSGGGTCSAFLLNPYPPMFQNGIDHYGHFSIPNQGTYCFRVGNNGIAPLAGNQADLFRYTFQVTPSNRIFKFRYAAVLQDGGHDSGENPYISFYLTKDENIYPVNWPMNVAASQMQLYDNTVQRVIAKLDNPFFKKSPVQSDVIYKDWQCIEYDLTEYMGQTLSLIFIARDCDQGGHFGYAYIDGLCTDWPAQAKIKVNKTEFCDDDQHILFDGSASTGEDRYFVEVAEVDAVGNYVPNGDIISEWFLGVQAPSSFDVTQWYVSKGKHFKCNKYYKLKLAVMNDCSEWNSDSKILRFNCPIIDAGPDQIICCAKEGLTMDNCIKLSTPIVSNYTYNWSSFPLGFTSYQPNTDDCPLESTAYILTVTDSKGCKATDSVIVRYKSSIINISIKTPKASQNGCTFCGNERFLQAVVEQPLCSADNDYFQKNYPLPSANEVIWLFFNEATNTFSQPVKGETFIPPNEAGTVYASLENGCEKEVVTTKLEKYTLPPEPTFWAANGMNLASTNPIAHDLVIFDGDPNGPTYGYGPAYGAEDFELRIYDRWGSNFRTIHKSDIGRAPDECLKQGDVRWNGKDQNGLDVPIGEYTFQLCMKYCPTTPNAFEQGICDSGWKQICAPNIAAGAVCCGDMKWVWFPPHWECQCNKPCAYSVTVIN